MSEKVINITSENYESILKSDTPVVVDFWATWCGPCQMLAPELEVVAKELEGKVKVGKVNVDEENELAAAFQISSIPTIAVIKDGKVLDISVGYKSRGELKALVEKL